MNDQNPSPAVSKQIASFRKTFRETEIPFGYSPVAHLLFTFVGGSAALAWSIGNIQSVRPLEWITVPAAFIYANLAEYFGHRFPMHHSYGPLKLVYKRHAGQHHRYFTEQNMPLVDALDLRAVLFPPLLVIFFFGGFGFPVWFALRELLSANVAWLFIATGLIYYLNYELLHLLHHAPASWSIGQTPLMRRWSALHRIHHDQTLMTRYNFNITYPIGDWLFGTWMGERNTRSAGKQPDD